MLSLARRKLGVSRLIRATSRAHTHPRPIRTPFATSGRFIWTENVTDLERTASKEPRDAYKQSLLYKAWTEQSNFQSIINRFETNQYEHDEACGREYVHALWRMGQLDRPSYAHMMNEGRAQFYDSRSVQSPRYSAQPGYAPPQYQQFRGPVMGHSLDNPVNVTIHDPTPNGFFAKLLASRFLQTLSGFLVTCTFFAGFVYYALARPGSGNGNDSVFDVLQRKVYKEPEDVDVTFDNIKGCDEVKHELEEIVAFLKNPDQFTRLGGRMPKGLLLVGPSGTGKTLLAKAVAGEAGVPFLYCAGSEFEEQFVGLGAKRIREVFAAAKKKAPCIIFMDEIDAVGGKRSAQGQSNLRASLNQLLVEMDGFESSNGVILIAATNFLKVLDPALLRPGRFDKQIAVPLPDLRGRKAILDLYVSKIDGADDIDTEVLARATPGSTGADLANLVNSAALYAATCQHQTVTMKDMEYARDKIQMGAERKSAEMHPEDLRCTAYHEGGHAIVNLFTEGSNPIHKATIMPRGQALGLVHQLPEKDQYSQTRKQLLAYLDVCMGGRVAEELVFGYENVTTGASSDLDQATGVAKNMVLAFGMGKRTGIQFHRDSAEYLETLAPETRSAIDSDVQELLTSSYQRVKHKLTKHRSELDTLAQALLKYETLDAKEIKQVMAGQTLSPERT